MINLKHIYFEGLKQELRGMPTRDEVIADFKFNMDKDNRVLIFKASIGIHVIEEWWDAHTLMQEFEMWAG